MLNNCEPSQSEPTFTSEQLAHAFGVSRSKILRVEKAGLISPKERSGRANSRHYDAATVLKLAKIFHYHDIGYTIEQTIRYFRGEEDLREIIQDVENRINELTNILNSLKNRTDVTQHLVVQETTSASAYYYCQMIQLPHGSDNTMSLIRDVASAAIMRGYTLRYELPITLVGQSFADVEQGAPVTSYLCIPIIDEVTGEDVLYLPREVRRCVNWFGASGNQYFINEYLQVLREQGIPYDADTLFRCDLLSYPLDPKLPRDDSWVVRFYLPAVGENLLYGPNKEDLR